MCPDRRPSDKGQHRNIDQQQNDHRRPKGDHDRARANDPGVFQNPKPKSSMAAGVAGENLIRIGGLVMLQIPAGFWRMPRLAIGGPGPRVVNKFARTRVQPALKMIPFSGIILTRCVEGEIVGDAVAANPEEDAENGGDDEGGGEDVKNEAHLFFRRLRG